MTESERELLLSTAQAHADENGKPVAIWEGSAGFYFLNWNQLQSSFEKVWGVAWPS